MLKSTQQAFDEWASGQNEKLHPRIRKLIALATWDLYNGPTMDGQDDDEDTEDGEKVKYPGFQNACAEILNALDGIHTDDIWIDEQFGEVLTSEPTYDQDEDNPDSPIVEPCWEDFVRIDSSQVKAAIIGSELSKHL